MKRLTLKSETLAELTSDDLCGYVRGPDFPTGGVIVESKAALLETYETGRGGIRTRARWTREVITGDNQAYLKALIGDASPRASERLAALALRAIDPAVRHATYRRLWQLLASPRPEPSSAQ